MTLITSIGKLGGGISFLLATDILARKIQEEYEKTIERKITPTQAILKASIEKP